jgi:hypothetical protein
MEFLVAEKEAVMNISKQLSTKFKLAQEGDKCSCFSQEQVCRS